MNITKYIQLGVVLAAAGFAGTVAKADTITVTLQEGGGPVTPAGSGSGAVLISGSTADFTVTGSAADNAPGGLPNPNLLVSQTVSVAATGPGTLTIIMTASGLTTPVNGNQIASSFRLDPLVGLTPNATVQEFTLFNGSPTGATATFNQMGAVTVGSAGPTFSPESLAGTFSVAEEYVITTDGAATFNAGINVAAIAVPGPIVGAGLPGLLTACGGLLALARRRRRQTV